MRYVKKISTGLVPPCIRMSLLLIVIFIILITGCGGGGSSNSTTPPVQSNGIIVSHANYNNCDTSSLASMQNIGTINLFFAHASVGANIVDGINTLHTTNSSRFVMTTQSVIDTPPSSTPAGIVYEYDRGNPGASNKVTSFEQYVSNGWRNPHVNVVLNKFCFIDAGADFTQYINSMSALEAANPSTVFIYATMPICNSDNDNNVIRESFNSQLRIWAQNNHKYLLDIADIESYDDVGNHYLFTNNGQSYPELYVGYTTDGGHLNSIGSVAVAKGLYTILNAIAAR